MIVQSFLGGRPGLRIEDYRNSQPRYIKLIGVGERAAALIDQFNTANRNNVLTSGALESGVVRAMDEAVDGIRPNAVIVVYETGDEVHFPFLTDRAASMLSFVVLEQGGAALAVGESKQLRELRSVADLYVTTSDPEFVAELVGNLAS